MPTKNVQPQSISVFDLDHTLLNCNSSFHFTFYLFKKKHLSLFKLLFIAGCYGLHKLGYTSLEKMYDMLFKRILLGKSSSDIMPLADAFITENLNNYLFQPIVNILKDAQKNGVYTVILSCSSNFLVAPIAKYMGINEWGAVCYSEDTDHCYTAISSFMGGQEKADYITHLSKKFEVSTKQITAYTDSHLDLPLLNVVGEAVCVNPDKKLQQIALKKSWKILK